MSFKDNQCKNNEIIKEDTSFKLQKQKPIDSFIV